MKKVSLKGLIVVFIASFLLTACGLGNAALPTLVPNVNNLDGRSNGNAELDGFLDESPRSGPAAGLPPTWTPGAPESEPDPPRPVSTAEAVETVESVAVNPVNEESRIYVVQAGDTLAEIAENFSVTLEQLASANNIVDVDHIETGQELLIPSP